MGCCFSTPTTQTQNQNNLTPHKNHRHEPPPPPPLEEESVKEVLSETPISKPQQVPILTPETKTHLPLLQDPPQNFETKDPIEEISEVVSQLTETCSMSESFSAATTATATTATVTVTREEDEATSKHSIRDGTTANHKWDRSPSRKRPYAVDVNLTAGRDRRLKSPARRPEPSPEKKTKTGSRPLRGRESGQAAIRKRNAAPAALRRDSGEGSGRRSRSPACARNGKVSTGGVRKEVAPVNAVEKVEKEKKSESEEAGERNDVVSPEECLENPHVSMECFIFL